MSDQSAGATVSGTAELCAYIIDFLHNSQDLKSCALNSRAFTFPAQTHLFHHLVFLGEAASCRLEKIFDASPHLRSLVRRVTAPFSSTILKSIRNLFLSRLNSLQLAGTSIVSEVGVLEIEAAQSLLALPSLHTLAIDGLFPNRDAFGLLFERCTPTIQLIRRPTFHAAPRARIEKLSMLQTQASDLGIWFLDSDCPLGLSFLQRVDLLKSTSSELARVLHNAGPTIEELRIHTQDITDGLVLAHFTALTTLRIFGDPPELASTLSSLPPRLDRLTEFIIASRAFQAYEACNGPIDDVYRSHFAEIDNSVAAVSLPLLKRFELSVLVPSVSSVYARPGNPVENTRESLMRAFPQMNSRGVLVVWDFRNPSWK
ncbi:NmrA domain-containing protein [Mycena sanguinolenta]|uniref:NmrA domain-containing protein n=1 Tax=Mycena sanguinolenta TaxID=230812 RepID=A0A8H6Z3W4_9AGAR|nr:NmrA domain-containing protein [Mycena sanguinolenta]